jgi:DNA modification methylase
MVSDREVPDGKVLKFDATPGFKGYKPFFISNSTTHPAKMNLNLLRWILETYTEPGEVVLDPMAGTGSTIILAALMGRHGVAMEYEPRFCDMIRANMKLTERQTTLIPKGRMTCIQGDARELSKLLKVSDAIITSPPFGEANQFRGGTQLKDRMMKDGRSSFYSEDKENIGNKPYGDISTIVTSPPFGPSTKGGGIFKEGYKAPGEEEVSDPGLPQRHARPLSDDPQNIDNLEYGESVDSIITSPPYAHGLRHRGQSYEEVREKLLARGYSEEYVKASWSQPHQCQHWAEEAYGDDERNIGNLPQGDIDAVITSPPYSEGTGHGGGPASEKLTLEKKLHLTGSEAYSKPLDAIVTSPPYEGSVDAKGDPARRAERMKEAGLDPKTIVGGKARYGEIDWRYSEDSDNIGNLRSESYLQAMLTVYRECYKVLKDEGGKLIVVTKNFIRDKQVVRLDEDTIKLCETSGFMLSDRWYFKLPTRSFWRILYSRRFPDVPEVKFEDILVFEKHITRSLAWPPSSSSSTQDS